MMNKNYEKLMKKLGGQKVFLSEPLWKYSSFRIGGPADMFYRAKTEGELVMAVLACRALDIPVFVMGGGTNLLISDRGFRGLVIKNDTAGIKLLGIKGKKTAGNDSEEGPVQTVYLSAESGVPVNRLVRFSLDQGFGGLEYFLGQPGTVGGAVYINAHNMGKGVFFGDKLVEAKILKSDGKIATVPASYFNFGYDQSLIQTSKETVLSVVIKLIRGDRDRLWHKAQEVLEYRHKTQPTGVYSAGCTFRNIKKSEAMRLATPNYTTSAGYLLDTLGLKGKKEGEAMFSDHHANFIVHRGKANAADVLKLINLAKDKVKEKFNINLHEEIILVGEF